MHFWHVKHDIFSLEGASSTFLLPAEIKDTILYYFCLRNTTEVREFSLNPFWHLWEGKQLQNYILQFDTCFGGEYHFRSFSYVDLYSD
jgi:hypothetical protein